MTEPTEEDIATLREDGDLPTYLRSLIHRRSVATQPTGATPADHRPGAWPTTCTPPASA